MARPLEFDRDAVLDAAMNQFWKEGYEASSIQKLLMAMGINRGSLYSSFGDKESLFITVLKRYEAIIDSFIEETLISMVDPLDAIRAYLVIRYDAFSKKQLGYGCLFFNSVSELARTQPQLVKGVIKKLAEIEKIFLSRLQEAQRKKMLADDANCADIARLISTLVGGLAVQSKQNTSKKEMLNVIDSAMSTLI